MSITNLSKGIKPTGEMVAKQN